MIVPLRFLIINGPNLNMLGIREKDLYGTESYSSLCSLIEKECEKLGIENEIFQSNHEGEIVDKIQAAYGCTDAIIINAAAYTHTSIAIADALKAVSIPVCEVHLTDVSSREEYRRISYITPCAVKCITGKGFEGYTEAVNYMCKHIRNK